MTTAENLSDKQIRDLRHEAVESGDYPMVAICNVALWGYYNITHVRLTIAERRRLRAMSRSTARTVVATTINAAEAQDNA